MDFWLQSKIGLKKTNNILVKTCSPYITSNFLYLLNATKSKKLYEVLNTNCEEQTGKFRWNQIFNICDAEWEQIFFFLIETYLKHKAPMVSVWN